MKVKSESEVAQSYPTLSDPVDCSPSGSSVHGIFLDRCKAPKPLPARDYQPFGLHPPPLKINSAWIPPSRFSAKRGYKPVRRSFLSGISCGCGLGENHLSRSHIKHGLGGGRALRPPPPITDPGKAGQDTPTNPRVSTRPCHTLWRPRSCWGAQVSTSSRECTRSPVLAALEIRGISCEGWKPFHSGALSSNSCGSAAVGRAGLRGGESPTPRPAACAAPLPGCAAPPADRSPSPLQPRVRSISRHRQQRPNWVGEHSVGPESTGFQGF